MLTQKSPKIPKKFWCHHCDYITLSKKDFNKHLLTAKHKMLTHADKDADTKIPKTKLNDFTCECGRVYKQRQSLHRHRKKCKYVENKNIETNESELSNENEINNVDEVKKMFYEVVANQQKQMAQLTEVITDSTKQMVESQKQMVEAKNTITNNTINNNNFNLNLFLNDTCKDAFLNIFVIPSICPCSAVYSKSFNCTFIEFKKSVKFNASLHVSFKNKFKLKLLLLIVILIANFLLLFDCLYIQR